MNEQSKCLLDECSSGCKMGVDSMEQAREYVKDEKLGKVMDSYMEKNRNLLQEAEQMLAEEGMEGKEPGMAAQAFSWLTTEVKLKLKDDSSQIAKLMMDGSNMGVQSLSKCINKNEDASRESKALAEKLVKTDDEFRKEL